MALALKSLATREDRDFRALLFGARREPVRVLDFGRGEDDIVELAEFFYGGSTDFEPALRQALAIHARTFGHRGDIVLISDGRCALSNACLTDVATAKRRFNLRIVILLMDLDRPTFAPPSRPWADRTLRVGSFLQLDPAAA